MKTADLVKVLAFYGRFTPSYSRTGYWARRLRWTPFTADFSGQRWLVTGASGGIGAAIAAGAARAGARVIAVARSAEKLEAARAPLEPDSAARMEPRSCDLSSVAAIDSLLDSLRGDATPIDVVVNNVGVLFNELSVTAEGFETTYATNLLGHYQLTEGILEAALLGAEPLLINMASGGLYNVPLNTTFLNVTDPRKYAGKAAYGSHKRAQVALSGLWDERLRLQGGRSYVMHPGWVRTEGVRTALPTFYKIQGLILRSAEEGADTAMWLAARRPGDSGRAIWFDRAVRPQHMFAHTRDPQCSEEELVDYLQRDLASARSSPQASPADPAAAVMAGESADSGDAADGPGG